MSRRRALAYAGLVVAGWLLVAGAAVPLAAQLTDVQRNDATLFLPADAEATQVLRLESGFQDTAIVPAVIVYERNSGVTDADRAVIQGEVARLEGLPGVSAAGARLMDSPDGQAVEVIVAVDSKVATVADAVGAIRGVVRGAPGMSVHVAGPAGLAADFGSAFKSLDVKLLIGTTLVVVVILLVVYRGPFLWMLPLVAVAVALVVAQAGVYLAARYAGLDSNGQSQGLLTVLLFGAGTDYALLLVSRYREELQREQAVARALLSALRGATPAILASGATVILSLLCLTLSQNGANRSLGPTGAIGIASAMVSMLTLLPALLVLSGRRAFWPLAPKFGDRPVRRGAWERIASAVVRRPRWAWITTTGALIALACGVVLLNSGGIPATEQYTVSVDSAAGQKIADAHFGSSSPVVIVASAESSSEVLSTVRSVPGVAGASLLPADGDPASPAVVDGRVLVQATLTQSADAGTPESIIERLRTALHQVRGSHALVGGQDAVALDTRNASKRDLIVITPLVLAIILVVLVVLLRSLVAPLILIATVALSFGAALGLSALVFRYVFHFGAEDSAFPLTAFVFLVALGIDYNIFLMSRVREAASRLGTRAGTVAGLASTGSVITSAGVVLAATFAVFATLPLVILAEVGLAVALGVLLDTLVVRTVLVPALAYELAGRIWWPRRPPADRAATRPELPAGPRLEPRLPGEVSV